MNIFENDDLEKLINIREEMIENDGYWNVLNKEIYRDLVDQILNLLNKEG